MNGILSIPAKNVTIFKSPYLLWFIHEIRPFIRSFLYLKSPAAPTCQRNKARHSLGPPYLSSFTSDPPLSAPESNPGGLHMFPRHSLVFHVFLNIHHPLVPLSKLPFFLQMPLTCSSPQNFQNWTTALSSPSLNTFP